MHDTLFDKYGGVPMVTRVVKDFHERLMRRPNIRRYFLDMPIDKVIDHHIAYVSYALGKPNSSFTSREIHDKHMNAGVTAASYDLITDLFIAALEDENVTEEDVQTIVARINQLRGEVVTKGLAR